MKQGSDIQTEATQTILLSVAEAARSASVSTKTIYRAAEDGRLKTAVLGRSGAIRTDAPRKRGGVR